MTVKHLKNLLDTGPDSGLNSGPDARLAGIVRRARDMGQLLVTLDRSLPAELKGGLLAANVRDTGDLVLICRSSAWAARLRFHGDELLLAARTTGVEPTRCKFKVSTG